MAALAPLVSERAVELELLPHDTAWVEGRREHLIFLIGNLVENAMKYCPPGTRVVVDLREVAHEVQLTVFDNGPGIAPALRERAFGRFTCAADLEVTVLLPRAHPVASGRGSP
ncbi:sensor histidine kinase [Herbaspirillum frisingense]|uniref:sensor histidine kinase n=1 Tax=Herbaspirillum frisingense TaxID=92645 RepID=UPI001602E0DD|nr:HAMP domain-containing sensor histidine kinase [Herbaspirillum frisingense]QNB06123.1 sensor histidine kinase [Herbaspirillum frisingense]